SSSYFYEAADGAMTFNATVDGATTKNTAYARSELREFHNGACYNWNLALGGTMTATLKVDSAPMTLAGRPRKEVNGPVHGASNELVRLYWDNNTVYFKNDISGSDGLQHQFFLTNSAGQTPVIALGDVFSYKIDAHGSALKVDVYYGGQDFSSTTTINSVW